MQMKKKSFFLRLFLSIYVLFVIVLNAALFLVIRNSYQLLVSQSKDRATAEQYNAANTLTRDLKSLEEQDVLTYEAILNDFSMYQTFYQTQEIYIELFRNGNKIIDGGFEIDAKERKEAEPEEGKQNILIRKVQSESYVFVAGSLGEPYQEYVLVLAYPLGQAVAAKNRMMITIAGMDAGASVLLAVILYFVLRKLMHPLSELSKATTEIADGNYDKKIPIVTQDEFGVLAQQFNRMSDSISGKINQLNEENEKKETLINDMAHELRTPLTAMLGYSEYLQMANIDPKEQAEVLEYLIHETKRLSKLSDTLLYLARIGADGVEMELISVEELTTELNFLFAERVGKEQMELTFETHADHFTGNYEMVQMLLTNLIENAIRACSQGGHIKVSFIQETSGVRVSVADDGIGMTQEEIDKIARPFYRIDKARSRKNGGVGLGVSLCSQIATYHKTTLNYVSHPNQGTCVSIIFTI